MGRRVVVERNRRGGNRVSREQMWEREKNGGTIRTIKLWDEFPERIWQAGRNAAIK